MKNLAKIIQISKPLHRLTIIIALLILLGAILALATPLFSKFIVDEIVAQVSGQGGSDRYPI